MIAEKAADLILDPAPRVQKISALKQVPVTYVA